MRRLPTALLTVLCVGFFAVAGSLIAAERMAAGMGADLYESYYGSILATAALGVGSQDP